jgi:hypothetical protein
MTIYTYVIAQKEKDVALFLGEFAAAKIGYSFVRDTSTSQAGEWTIIKKFDNQGNGLLQSIGEKHGARSAQYLFELFKITVR